jgi:putative methyltransferase (TIGR04325 family)
VKARSQLREWLPPGARRAANRLLGASLAYRGPHADFATAAELTRGYDDDAILEQVVAATREVLAGRARYEQDGRSFEAEPPPSHALSLLLLAAARANGRLQVLDFGGSLGSHYLRWKPVLAKLPHLHWCVVEQPGFVAAGRELFAGDACIAFEEDIAAAAARAPNVVFASSVLQYLPQPADTLAQLAGAGAQLLVLDRFPVLERGPGVALSQHLPRRQGGASYPLHAFAKDFLPVALAPRYAPMLEFEAADEPIRTGGVYARYRGSAWLAQA